MSDERQAASVQLHVDWCFLFIKGTGTVSLGSSFIISLSWELRLTSETGDVLETSNAVQTVGHWGRKLAWFSRIQTRIGAITKRISQKRKEGLYIEAYETNSVSADDERARSSCRTGKECFSNAWLSNVRKTLSSTMLVPVEVHLLCFKLTS